MRPCSKRMMWPRIKRSRKGDVVKVSEKFHSADKLTLAVVGTLDAKYANAFYGAVLAW